MTTPACGGAHRMQCLTTGAAALGRSPPADPSACRCENVLQNSPSCTTGSVICAAAISAFLQASKRATVPQCNRQCNKVYICSTQRSLYETGIATVCAAALLQAQLLV
jgi:hypothetical protein